MNNVRFDYGVNTLLWSEAFGLKEEDIQIIYHVKDLGCSLIDIAVPCLDGFYKKQIGQALKDTGLKAVLNFNMTEEANPISPDASSRANAGERIRRLIDLAAETGAERISGVLGAAWGYKTNRPRTPDEWKWSAAYMREAAEYAKNQGNIIISVEIINRYVTHFLNTAADAVRYCQDVGMDNVKVHLDSFHMNMEENGFRDAIFHCGKKYLGFFHACESHRGIPGTGVIPWKEVFRSLIEIGYEGGISIESFDPDFVNVTSKSCIWRKFAESGDELALKGLSFLRQTEKTVREEMEKEKEDHEKN